MFSQTSNIENIFNITFIKSINMKKIFFIVILIAFSFTSFSQDQYINGNLAVGTSSRTDIGTLHVTSSNTSVLPVIRIESETNSDLSFIRFQAKNSSSVNKYSDILFDPDTGNLAFKTPYNSAEKMTIATSGNIGIGTTSPKAKLDIFGSNSNTTNLILSANYENSYRWRFKTIDRGNAIDMDITASDSGDNEEAVIKLSRSSSGRPEFRLYNNAIVANNGNVGIGNDSPTEKLHVSGNILGNKLMLNDPNNTSDWNTLWQSGFYQSYNATNAPEADVWFWGLNMNHSSNSSSYKYNGQIAIKNSSTSPTMYFRSTTSNGTGTWAKVLHSEGSHNISGNLGIGTTDTKGFKLGVQGKIAAEEVKVATYSNWSDFVFEENYNLPTLKEVEQHIKDNGHLKDIPNAEEVQKEGFYLAEMNAKLLQKIEELTLYTIEQEKKIEIQNQDILELKKENKVLKSLLERVEKLEEKAKF